MSASVTNVALGPDFRLAVTPHSTVKLPSMTSKGRDLSSKATEFEAILLAQWLQGSQSAFGSVPGEEDDKDAGADQMASFAFQHLASGLAEKGGIGIGKIVQKALAMDSNAGLSPEPPSGTAGYSKSGMPSDSPGATQKSIDWSHGTQGGTSKQREAEQRR